MILVALLLVPSIGAQASASGVDVAGLTMSGSASYFSEQQKMLYLRTVIAKIRETAKAMKDLSELEALGMPGRETERLQNAMKIKAEQLTDEALVLIRAL